MILKRQLKVWLVKYERKVEGMYVRLIVGEEYCYTDERIVTSSFFNQLYFCLRDS